MRMTLQRKASLFTIFGADEDLFSSRSTFNVKIARTRSGYNQRVGVFNDATGVSGLTTNFASNFSSPPSNVSDHRITGSFKAFEIKKANWVVKSELPPRITQSYRFAAKWVSMDGLML